MMRGEPEQGEARRAGWPKWVLFGLLAAGGFLQLLDFGSRVEAARASAAMDAGGYGEAQGRAEMALQFNPYAEAPAFTRCMALRAMNRPERASYAESLAKWHPQRGLLELIAGEAWLEQNQPARAAADLWEGLWTNPIPAESPAIFWRDAWQASLGAYGANDARTRAAREMTAAQLTRDRTLPPGVQRGIAAELSH